MQPFLIQLTIQDCEIDLHCIYLCIIPLTCHVTQAILHFKCTYTVESINIYTTGMCIRYAIGTHCSIKHKTSALNSDVV